jgi:hypothetical protein
MGDKTDALFVAPNQFFTIRRVLFATLAVRNPTSSFRTSI